MTMTTPTLLGYLAKFGSFSNQSELLCTQGLAYLLQTYEDARSAMVHEVKTRTGIELSEPLKWIAEKQQEDGARPDLEAMADDVPIVKIEAKLGAELTENQLQSYVSDLRQRNSGKGALLVLVPEGRIEEAAKVTAAAFDLVGSDHPWPATDGQLTGMAVISWDELFDTLKTGKDERFRYELEQLQTMYRVLSGSFIAPLASDEDLRQLGEREADFINLVDQATRILSRHHKNHEVNPMQYEKLAPPSDAPLEWEQKFYYRRYLNLSPHNTKSCYSIGVRDSFAEWTTPIWLRFNKTTGDFGSIRQRIEASDLRYLESEGHIWMPLDIPLEELREQMVQALVEQAEDVVRVACP